MQLVLIDAIIISVYNKYNFIALTSSYTESYLSLLKVVNISQKLSGFSVLLNANIYKVNILLL